MSEPVDTKGAYPRRLEPAEHACRVITRSIWKDTDPDTCYPLYQLRAKVNQETGVLELTEDSLSLLLTPDHPVCAEVFAAEIRRSFGSDRLAADAVAKLDAAAVGWQQIDLVEDGPGHASAAVPNPLLDPVGSERVARLLAALGTQQRQLLKCDQP